MKLKSSHWALLALVVCLSWWGGGWESLLPDPHEWERHAIVGVWTEPDGPPGNYVRLELVESEHTASNAILKALDGKATIFQQFGMAEETHANWNYESWHPLRLNVVHANTGMFLAVEFSDPDHATMRLLDDIQVASQPDVMSSPEARRFVRVAD